jgi:hypothetical protein
VNLDETLPVAPVVVGERVQGPRFFPALPFPLSADREALSGSIERCLVVTVVVLGGGCSVRPGGCGRYEAQRSCECFWGDCAAVGGEYGIIMFLPDDADDVGPQCRIVGGQ